MSLLSLIKEQGRTQNNFLLINIFIECKELSPKIVNYFSKIVNYFF